MHLHLSAGHCYSSVGMSPDSVEVRATVRQSPALVWEVIGDPELYPRFVRGLSWCERLTQQSGRGARYLIRAGYEDETEILIFRRDEHLVWSSVREQRHRL